MAAFTIGFHHAQHHQWHWVVAEHVEAGSRIQVENNPPCQSGFDILSLRSAVATAPNSTCFGGQRVAMKRGSDFRYLHGDQLGSTVMETGANGKVAANDKVAAI
ncbi:hypothetical protein KC887_07550 [Candidatus Kaiserbacteria bacterium]|nr:hypothetical protein [Candidatus Kaiserbacteria bacterium]